MNSVYTLTLDSISLVIRGKTYIIKKSDAKFEQVFKLMLQAVENDSDEEMEAIVNVISPGKSIEQWLKGAYTFKDKQLYYNDELVPSDLHNRLLVMAREGEDPSAWLNFWARLQKNPSYRSVNQLYKFMIHSNIPVSKDGYLLTYKSVRADTWCDHHTGKHKNTVGSVHEMPRNKISDDPTLACHDGFHVGALGYVESFRASATSVIVVCAVDPADVVCVPHDANSQKIRVCKYKVIGVHGQPLADTVEDIQVESVEDKPGVVLNHSSDAPTETIELDEEDKNWRSLNLDNLRKFASRKLHIVRASRMSRAELVEKIESLLKR